MEGLVIVAILAGATAMLAAWIWVVVVAFKDSIAWGVFSFLLNPAALVYALGPGRKRCTRPLVLFGVGVVVFAAGVVTEKLASQTTASSERPTVHSPMEAETAEMIQEAKMLQGTWNLVYMRFGSLEILPTTSQSEEWVFMGDKLSCSGSKGPKSGQYVVFPGRKYNQIDWSFKEDGMTNYGIFRISVTNGIEGLVICYSHTKDLRPEDFRLTTNIMAMAFRQPLPNLNRAVAGQVSQKMEKPADVSSVIRNQEKLSQEMDQFIDRLRDFGHTHPDLMPILARYDAMGQHSGSEEGTAGFENRKEVFRLLVTDAAKYAKTHPELYPILETIGLKRTTSNANHAEQDGAANGSQPFSSDTNRTSSAAGSHR